MLATRAELVDREIVYLLEVEIAGHVYRWATQQVAIVTEAGDVLEYFEGLGDLELGTSFDGAADASISIELDSDLAWATLVGQFARVERSPATVLRWVEGLSFERAEILLTGHVSGFSYGEQYEPVSFDVVRRMRTTSTLIPLPGMVIDEHTWPNRSGFTCDERLQGVFYPMVFGTPGKIGNTVVAATEALLVEWRAAPATDYRLLIAGHRVAAATVTIFDYSDEGVVVSHTASVVHELDAAGRMCALVDPVAAGFSNVDFGREYYIGWNGVAAAVGRPGGLVGAGDLIEWVLRTFTSTRIDAARFAAVRDQLNAYRLSPAIVNEQVDPADWLANEVVPLLPIEPRQGPAGLWYRMRRTSATSGDVVAVLNADTGQVQRASQIRWESDQVVNEVTVQFAEDRATGRMLRRVVVGGRNGGRDVDPLDPDLPATDTRFLGNYRARISQRLFGEVLPITIDAPACYDPATAVRIAKDVLDEQALPRRTVDYDGGSDLVGLEEGDIVEIRDSSVGLIGQLAEVRDPVASGATVRLMLLLLDDPALVVRLGT